MIRDRGGSRIEGNRQTYGNDNFQRSSGEEILRSFANRNKAAQGWNQGTELKEDKGPGKKVAELKEGQKAATNPYAKPILGKCYCCGQPGHKSNELSLRCNSKWKICDYETTLLLIHEYSCLFIMDMADSPPSTPSLPPMEQGVSNEVPQSELEEEQSPRCQRMNLSKYLRLMWYTGTTPAVRGPS
ncbi:hypothetical protein M9H77_13358 [Catharanthus roseus]|uniref:Uncharacterized protein n=1 Tax=Catharanthus roseus TaxID=4058 RepID=A0ACC0BJX3_CATRO|nr:hypothetical protein M9H77_13358 [Catharanthus roseus]